VAFLTSETRVIGKPVVGLGLGVALAVSLRDLLLADVGAADACFLTLFRALFLAVLVAFAWSDGFAATGFLTNVFFATDFLAAVAFFLTLVFLAAGLATLVAVFLTVFLAAADFFAAGFVTDCLRAAGVLAFLAELDLDLAGVDFFAMMSMNEVIG
jgi:hypothetical protein